MKISEAKNADLKLQLESAEDRLRTLEESSSDVMGALIEVILCTIKTFCHIHFQILLQAFFEGLFRTSKGSNLATPADTMLTIFVPG